MQSTDARCPLGCRGVVKIPAQLPSETSPTCQVRCIKLAQLAEQSAALATQVPPPRVRRLTAAVYLLTDGVDARITAYSDPPGMVAANESCNK